MVVIGGGVIGLCSALALAAKGMHVTVLEASEEESDSCSTGNAGMIVPSHFVPLAAPGMALYGLKMLLRKDSPFGFSWPPSLEMAAWAIRFLRASNPAQAERAGPVLRDLNLLSRARYRELHETLGIEGLRESGLTMLCETHHALDEERGQAERAETLGLRVQVLDKAALQREEPQVEIEAVGGVKFLDDASLDPPAFLRAVRSELRRRGAHLEYGCPATEFSLGVSRVDAVRTRQGEFPADEFVLAGGVATGELARGLGLRLPLVGGKGYGFTVAEPPVHLRACAILVEARVALTPMPAGLRVAGTMELGARDLRVSPRRLGGIRASVRRCLPALQTARLEDAPVWAGLRPCSPDGLPYLGRTSRWPNLTLAAGHAMMGLSLGPATGEIVGQIVAGEPTSIPIELLDPDRYA